MVILRRNFAPVRISILEDAAGAKEEVCTYLAYFDGNDLAGQVNIKIDRNEN